MDKQTPSYRTFDRRAMLVQLRRATQRWFQRRREALPALGVESAMPSLEISRATLAVWAPDVQRQRAWSTRAKDSARQANRAS